MKKLFLEKFNDFTKAMAMDFHESITRNLPASDPDPANRYPDRNTPIWGFTEEGFWTMTSTEARFYEHDGTIHAVSTKYTPNYVAAYKALSSKLVNMRSLTIAEHDSFAITNSNHISLPKKATVYYVKFTSPNGELGAPVSSMLLTGKMQYNLEFCKNAIDSMVQVFAGLKETNSLCPSVFTLKYFLVDSQGMYLGIVKDFNMNFNDAVAMLSAGEMRAAGSVTEADIPTITEYNKTKWQTLTT